MEHQDQWYDIKNISEIDSPAFIIYPDRIQDNIRKMIDMAGGIDHLRPHVKTNKMLEVIKMMMSEGIEKFKCATISEAEMLGLAEAGDVLLAYQPVGPKAKRLLTLVRVFPSTVFSALVDNEVVAIELSEIFINNDRKIDVFIDLNVGNDRTGIKPGIRAEILFRNCLDLQGINVRGFHVYDGHIRDRDLKKRTDRCDKDFKIAERFINASKELRDEKMEIIAGGTPTFPIHAKREGVTCSPGTVLLWDYGYGSMFTDLDFDWAALIITRVVSVISEKMICVDLGHKSIASENPFPRVHFLNTGKLEQVGHSEEHLVLKVLDGTEYKVGEVFYGVPFHICPTTALYERAMVVENGEVNDEWLIIARDRRITI